MAEESREQGAWGGETGDVSCRLSIRPSNFGSRFDFKNLRSDISCVRMSTVSLFIRRNKSFPQETGNLRFEILYSTSRSGVQAAAEGRLIEFAVQSEFAGTETGRASGQIGSAICTAAGPQYVTIAAGARDWRGFVFSVSSSDRASRYGTGDCELLNAANIDWRRHYHVILYAHDSGRRCNPRGNLTPRATKWSCILFHRVGSRDFTTVRQAHGKQQTQRGRGTGYRGPRGQAGIVLRQDQDACRTSCSLLVIRIAS